MLSTDPKTQNLLARLAALQAEAKGVIRRTELAVSDADRLLVRSRMLLAARPVRIREDESARR